MIVKDLGVLDGPVLVFGGIYSNLQAFEAMLAEAARLGIAADHMVCTGDLVAYCADGAQVIVRMRELNIPTIKGNCEEQLAQDGEDCGCGFDEGSVCSMLSRGWYANAKATIPKADKDWMGALPDRIVFEHMGLRYGVIHGAVSDISQFIWPVTDVSEIRREISMLSSEVGSVGGVLAGHSGVPMQAKADDVLWTNSGSIGMPANNGSQSTSYVILDDNGVNFRSLTYDVQAAYDAMEAVGLNQGYHDSLISGYWPSQDTLPEIMRVKPTDDGSVQVP